ncbi:Hsp20/alpha crystallin family protein [Paramicrobacterium agarici]|uniref:HSP20 family protein n=1 Tax=Paramicrobacterium agarici TaxID=630514 RepID=A0A2A9DZC6_9MICO|nr:Hsp20/alpha crystallin family protein [Microbacterium agarici]PFG31954.1 HSP20 family protein [Microbacterium agarici]TQO21845.1 HSP20 family protein [Microbacterium agarici]
MVMTFDPLSQLDRVASSIFYSARGPSAMPVDLHLDGDRYILSADLPGIDPGSIDINVDGSLLTLRAQRSIESGEHVRWLTRERFGGSLMRQFTLGEGIDTEGISASYQNGVLSLIIPLSERARPRKIEVEQGAPDAPAAINA